MRVDRTTRTCQARIQNHLNDSKQEDRLEEHPTVAAESQGGSLEAGTSLPEVSLAPSDRCLRKKGLLHLFEYHFHRPRNAGTILTPSHNSRIRKLQANWSYQWPGDPPFSLAHCFSFLFSFLCFSFLRCLQPYLPQLGE